LSEGERDKGKRVVLSIYNTMHTFTLYSELPSAAMTEGEEIKCVALGIYSTPHTITKHSEGATEQRTERKQGKGSESEGGGAREREEENVASAIYSTPHTFPWTTYGDEAWESEESVPFGVASLKNLRKSRFLRCGSDRMYVRACRWREQRVPTARRRYRPRGGRDRWFGGVRGGGDKRGR
jgi:hypothetical protein